MSNAALLDRESARSLMSQMRRDHRELDTLMLRHGESVHILRYFGKTIQARNQPQLAHEIFIVALSVWPNEACLWVDLALVLKLLDRSPEARRCVEAALSLDAGSVAAWVLLGVLASQAKEDAVCEEAYRRALALDPDMASAHYGLGVACFNRSRFAEASEHVGRAVDLGLRDAVTYQTLGTILYLVGDYAEACDAFGKALSLGDLDVASRRKFARARMLASMIEGDMTLGVERYRETAGVDAEDLRGVKRGAFELLCASNHTEAAISLGTLSLAEDPDDPIIRYLLDAVRGASLSTTPPGYIEALYDSFAPNFEAQLVDVLRYDVPAKLVRLVRECRQDFSAAADIGCGTGLAAPMLRAIATQLTGLDLSARMLERASGRRLYDRLLKTEAVAFLKENPSSFDLIFSADMLIYVGDLSLMMENAAQALKPGGILAFSIESTTKADFAICPTGRFAHSYGYIETLAKRNNFVIRQSEETDIRLEDKGTIRGFLFVLECEC